jgi:predicted  nucleic acid-binding Zn-ribbon protein
MGVLGVLTAEEEQKHLRRALACERDRAETLAANLADTRTKIEREIKELRERQRRAHDRERSRITGEIDALMRVLRFLLPP